MGIPGKCSQENGTPEKRRGVAAGLMRGESWGKCKDPREEEREEREDKDENEGVRRRPGGEVLLLFLLVAGKLLLLTI